MDRHKPSYKATAVNLLLLAIIVLSNSYVLWGLFGPRVTLTILQATGKEPSAAAAVRRTPDDNRLIIPGIFVDQPIIEGSTEAALVKGPWHRPGTSSPDRGGNTVIAGHRFTYQGPSSFYNFDKIKTGDTVEVAWNRTIYTYKVSEIKEVAPNDPTIEAPTTDNRLTLYTCAPLWTTKHRLVIIATPMAGEAR